jgi:DNA-binding IclR family transcriptional regulator
VAYEIGSAYQRQVPLRRVAQPILSRLVLQTRENAHLAVLHGQDVYYVIEERAPRRSPLVSDVGVRLPATVTASGLAILAALSSRQVRAIFPHPADLVQRDGRGPGTLTELRRMLVDVRRQGYSYEDGLITPELSSVGVAVRDHTGYPVAAVAITFQTSRIGPSPRRRLAAAASRAAETLAARLAR